MIEYVYRPSPEMSLAIKQLPHVAEDRKKLAKSLRAARRRNPALTRLMWKKYLKGSRDAISMIFNEGTAQPLTGISLLLSSGRGKL